MCLMDMSSMVFHKAASSMTAKLSKPAILCQDLTFMSLSLSFTMYTLCGASTLRKVYVYPHDIPYSSLSKQGTQRQESTWNKSTCMNASINPLGYKISSTLYNVEKAQILQNDLIKAKIEYHKHRYS